MINATNAITAAAATTLIVAPAASAYVNTMFDSADPATFGSLVQSLDIASTSWNFPFDTGTGKTNSGFKAEILDPGTGAPITLDPTAVPATTRLVTNVFRVDTPTTLTQGSDSISLTPGDLVFSYSIQLTGGNANTVDSLREFTVTAFADALGGEGVFDSTILKGRGFSLDGLASPAGNTPAAEQGDLTESPFFSSLDWSWGIEQSGQLQNGSEIQLLMFSRPAQIVGGTANFIGVPGQAITGTDPLAVGAPVLIPLIPAPGSAALLALAGLAASRRRR
jgi:hypothetical protein